MVTRPVIDNSADTITLNRANVVLFRQLFKQFKYEKMLNMEFCMIYLRIHLVPTNEVAKVLSNWLINKTQKFGEAQESKETLRNAGITSSPW